MVAPTGHASAHAVGFPRETRFSKHISHFFMYGASFDHSYRGTLCGHAIMQYRHPTHFFLSYTTGPRSVFVSAPTRQAEAQAGCSQWRHCLRTNFPSLSCTTVNAVSESFGSGSP